MLMIAMIGAFPPPLHGMAAVNSAMKSFLESKGEAPVVFDISAKILSRAWNVRLMRAVRILWQLVRFAIFIIRQPSRISVYMSLSGGYGQIYEIFFILISRLCKANIFIHHHNFKYIDSPCLVTRLLIKTCGAGVKHVVLCDIMSRKLKLAYPSASRTLVLSNAAFLPVLSEASRIRERVKTVGFLGNIEADKGIFEFLDAIARLKSDEKNIHAMIAGPFQDKGTEARLKEQIANLENVRYVGPKYGEEKRQFFDSIDVLLYPTKNDAEPLTVLEGMAQGVPVIAWARGCIAEIIPDSAGVVIDYNEDYVPRAVDRLRSWLECPDLLTEKSQGARQQYVDLKNRSDASLLRLYSAITEG